VLRQLAAPASAAYPLSFVRFPKTIPSQLDNGNRAASTGPELFGRQFNFEPKADDQSSLRWRRQAG